ncbi:hypothetical protein JCGZ_26529 [Jatropha curcas]|uniref:Uncharacterized protein n=1 Tax=Jatropha curcas TaxID=180498 RepID=A0A067JX50_JATCU|nr:hypothetical protein JCGZ_26529 [Jatropha curcas]
MVLFLFQPFDKIAIEGELIDVDPGQIGTSMFLEADACLHLWDLQAHLFRFDTHYEEMCPTYEDFAALLGSDFERALVATPTRVRFFKSFMRILGLYEEEARGLVVEDRVGLFGLIELYLDPLDFVDLERQRFKTRALVFCLMERGAGIASMALAETLLSLGRAYRVDGFLSASPILL